MKRYDKILAIISPESFYRKSWYFSMAIEDLLREEIANQKVSLEYSDKIILELRKHIPQEMKDRLNAVSKDKVL